MLSECICRIVYFVLVLLALVVYMHVYVNHCSLLHVYMITIHTYHIYNGIPV